MYNLFLDDERYPEEIKWEVVKVVDDTYPHWEKFALDKNWVVVRTVEEFQKYIEEKGLPNSISFDHDLGAFPDKTLRPDGADAARWLAYRCLDTHTPYPTSYIHSKNHQGHDRISSLINSCSKVIAADQELS